MSNEPGFIAVNSNIRALSDTETIILELITSRGDVVPIVLTGELLLGIKGQIDDVEARLPVIAQWKGRKTH